MIRVKSIKGIEERPSRGQYTKTGKYIIEEFLKDKRYKHAEVDLEFDKLKELYSLYHAIKTLIRRSNPKLNMNVSVSKRERKLYLSKLEK